MFPAHQERRARLAVRVAVRSCRDILIRPRMAALTMCRFGLGRLVAAFSHLPVEQPPAVCGVARTAPALDTAVRARDDNASLHAVPSPTDRGRLGLRSAVRPVLHVLGNMILRRKGGEVCGVDTGAAMALVVNVPPDGIRTEGVDVNQDVRWSRFAAPRRSGMNTKIPTNRDTSGGLDNPTRPRFLGSGHSWNMGPVGRFVKGAVA